MTDDFKAKGYHSKSEMRRMEGKLKDCNCASTRNWDEDKKQCLRCGGKIMNGFKAWTTDLGPDSHIETCVEESVYETALAEIERLRICPRCFTFGDGVEKLEFSYRCKRCDCGWSSTDQILMEQLTVEREKVQRMAGPLGLALGALELIEISPFDFNREGLKSVISDIKTFLAEFEKDGR